MAMRTGFSHGLATLLMTLVAALMVGYLNHVGASNFLFDWLTALSTQISLGIASVSSIAIPHEFFVPVIVASLLAFVWGMLFHFIRFRSR